MSRPATEGGVVICCVFVIVAVAIFCFISERAIRTDLKAIQPCKIEEKK